MKKILLVLTLLLSALSLTAQDAILERVRQANAFDTMTASFRQVRHSSLLTQDLVSEGFVAMQQPGKIRWEIRKPSTKVSILDGEGAVAGRRFRLPSEKDFAIKSMEGEAYVLTLEPLRRDLRQLFRQIIVQADKNTGLVQTVMLMSPDGDWTRLEFSEIRSGMPLDAKLFTQE